MLTIAVDFDDVLFPFNARFAEYHNKLYGTSRTYEDLFSYQMELVWGCDTKTIVSRVRDFYFSDEHSRMEPTPGATEAIAQLAQENHLEVVTSRPEQTKAQVYDLVSWHFSGHFRDIHFTNGFASPIGARTRRKSEVCQEIGARILIDDALSHATDVARSGIPVLMPDRPWNQGEVPLGVERVSSWDEIVARAKTNI